MQESGFLENWKKTLSNVWGEGCKSVGKFCCINIYAAKGAPICSEFNSEALQHQTG